MRNNQIVSSNKKMDILIQNYNFCQALEINNQGIEHIIKESTIIMINSDRMVNEEYFIFVLNKTIFFIDKSSKSFVQNLFSINPKLKVYFLSDSKNSFIQTYHIEFIEANYRSTFFEEIRKFNRQINFKQTNKINLNNFLNTICPCISGYMIEQGYSKSNINRIQKLLLNTQKNEKQEEINENEYIQLRTIRCDTYSMTELAYNIKKEELCVIKKLFLNDKESEHLIQREFKNYAKLSHPLLPSFYGMSNKLNCIVIEYINGSNLLNIEKFNFTFNEKITIIFELALIFEYLHVNNYVYRDLKPNNVMIDENKTAVLIDFDRMIYYDKNSKDTEHSNNFASSFVAPEVNSEIITNKSDIYSLGMMIYFIVNEKDPVNDKVSNDDELNKHPKLKEIFNRCTLNNYKKRPLIPYIIFEIILNYHSQIQIENLPKVIENCLSNLINTDSIDLLKIIVEDKIDSEALKFIGDHYLMGYCVDKNIEKAVSYYDQAANCNHLKSQMYLAVIYSQGSIVERDINKSIYYYSLAANQKDVSALFALGSLYYQNKDVPRDINKTIHYYSLASKLNHSLAQYLLGSIYEKGEYVPKDLNKAIHYYNLAANQNHPQAQFALGKIYFHQDISKSFNYFLLSANQNCDIAQFTVGAFYFKGYYVKQDIDKAIYYLSLASKQNLRIAHVNLGFVYLNGYFVPKDIDKALYYYNLAAIQNDSHSQYIIGSIYLEGTLVTKDIAKAIHYLTLSANQNHPISLYNLAVLYLKGLYVDKDTNKAISYYILAAKQNFIPALDSLGISYLEGKFVPQDINKALNYFTLAANHNFINSLYNLAIIYKEGKYVNRDIKKAIYYFSRAADLKDSKSQMNLGEIYLYGELVSKDLSRAIYYYSLAAENNHPHALFNLGLAYFQDKRDPANIIQSIHYLTLSADQNDKKAQYLLGLIYEDGLGVPKDIKKAFKYYTLSAEQKYPDALFRLGHLYVKCKNGPIDINKIIHYYFLAAIQGNRYAQYYLGILHIKGLCIEQNINRGMFLLIESAKKGSVIANFCVGCLYHEGTYVKCDINKAIIYYKNASSINSIYAKNNLAIIYKNGFKNELSKRLGYAIELFNEVIRLNNNKIAKYNLAHLYLFDDPNKDKIDDAIKLLVESSEQDFKPSQFLLSFVLIKRYGLDFIKISSEISKYSKEENELTEIVNQIDLEYQISEFLSDLYYMFAMIDFMYDIDCNYSLTIILANSKTSNQENVKLAKITNKFYEGFGHDLI